MSKLGFAFMLSILSAAPLQAQPPYDCSAQGHHRDFDFWLGHWEVSDSEGKQAGHNIISTAQKGCLLNEHWTSAAGNTGQSSNFYNPVTGQWRQLWVDAGSSIIDISGGLDDDSMVLTGSIFYLKAGTKHAFRGRWTPLKDGSVRQFFEQQDSDGKWQVWFEGFYRRVSTG